MNLSHTIQIGISFYADLPLWHKERLIHFCDVILAFRIPSSIIRERVFTRVISVGTRIKSTYTLFFILYMISDYMTTVFTDITFQLFKAFCFWINNPYWCIHVSNRRV